MHIELSNLIYITFRSTCNLAVYIDSCAPTLEQTTKLSQPPSPLYKPFATSNHIKKYQLFTRNKSRGPPHSPILVCHKLWIIIASEPIHHAVTPKCPKCPKPPHQSTVRAPWWHLEHYLDARITAICPRLRWKDCSVGKGRIISMEFRVWGVYFHRWSIQFGRKTMMRKIGSQIAMRSMK